MKLYVGNLPYSTNKPELEEHFGQYGQVGEVTLINDRDTGKFRGFGFVEMASGGEAAIEGLHNTNFNGGALTVNEAKPKPGRHDDRSGRDRG